MFILSYSFVGLYFLSASLVIYAHQRNRSIYFYLTKPMPVFLLMGYYVFHQAPTSFDLIFWALLFSLLGDMILMASKRFFVFGLISFLLALICYGLGFSGALPYLDWHLFWILIPLSAAGFISRPLWPNLGKLKLGVMFYMAAIVFMVWRIMIRYLDPNISIEAYYIGLIGALMFMMGDSLLAWRRFNNKSIPYVLEISPYFIAQYCLILSLYL